MSSGEGTDKTRGALDAFLRDRFGWTPYRLLALLTLFGCAASILIDMTMWFIVDGYSPVSQTISELAAGPHHWLQDAGIIAFVIGVLALAAGLILRGTGDMKAMIVRGAFLLVAIDIALIALWNEYGDGEPGGIVIHKWLLLGLYVLVATLLWLTSSVHPVRSDSVGKHGKVIAVVWIVIAPLFFAVPTSVDGLYERFLALFLIGIVSFAAFRLYQKPDA